MLTKKNYRIDSIRLGTTVGTNALLENKGERVLFVTTLGFRDALNIRYQNRPELFNLNIIKRDPLYSDVLEIHERILFNGTIDQKVDLSLAEINLKKFFKNGIK